jgi:hypothetical protein
LGRQLKFIDEHDNLKCRIVPRRTVERLEGNNVRRLAVVEQKKTIPLELRDKISGVIGHHCIEL